MPVGTGAASSTLVPNTPYAIDPGAFFAATRKNVAVATRFSTPGEGSSQEFSIPRAGIVSKLTLTFAGSVVVTNNTGSVTVATGADGSSKIAALLEKFRLSLNGSQDVFSCSGLDLHALAYVRYPAYEAAEFDIPDGSLSDGTYDVEIAYEVPVAVDDVSLVGALFAQSNSVNITGTVKQAANDDAFDVTGDATVAVSGTWSVEVTHFDVPTNGEGTIVIPDLSKVHLFLDHDTPMTNTGANRLDLVRYPGQLLRLFVNATNGSDELVFGTHSASTDEVEKLELTYGGNRTPLSYDPAWSLVRQNAQHYGRAVPHDRAVIDTIRENPQRDAILMQGVTELGVIATIGSGVTLSSAKLRAAQEVLV